ncbi:hypothetical protein RCL1_008380 [Eukaryota sp. TZLM3-RCL]
MVSQEPTHAKGEDSDACEKLPEDSGCVPTLSLGANHEQVSLCNFLNRFLHRHGLRSNLLPLSPSDLFSKLTDGRILIDIVSSLASCNNQFLLLVETERTTEPSHLVSLCFSILNESGIRLASVTPNDVLQGVPDACTSLLWQCVFALLCIKFTRRRSADSMNKVAIYLLTWVNTEISDFSPPTSSLCFKDGKILSILAHKLVQKSEKSVAFDLSQILALQPFDQLSKVGSIISELNDSEFPFTIEALISENQGINILVADYFHDLLMSQKEFKTDLLITSSPSDCVDFSVISNLIDDVIFNDCEKISFKKFKLSYTSLCYSERFYHYYVNHYRSSFESYFRYKEKVPFFLLSNHHHQVLKSGRNLSLDLKKFPKDFSFFPTIDKTSRVLGESRYKNSNSSALPLGSWPPFDENFDEMFTLSEVTSDLSEGNEKIKSKNRDSINANISLKRQKREALFRNLISGYSDTDNYSSINFDEEKELKFNNLIDSLVFPELSFVEIPTIKSDRFLYDLRRDVLGFKDPIMDAKPLAKLPLFPFNSKNFVENFPDLFKWQAFMKHVCSLKIAQIHPILTLLCEEINQSISNCVLSENLTPFFDLSFVLSFAIPFGDSIRGALFRCLISNDFIKLLYLFTSKRSKKFNKKSTEAKASLFFQTQIKFLNVFEHPTNQDVFIDCFHWYSEILKISSTCYLDVDFDSYFDLVALINLLKCSLLISQPISNLILDKYQFLIGLSLFSSLILELKDLYNRYQSKFSAKISVFDDYMSEFLTKLNELPIEIPSSKSVLLQGKKNQVCKLFGLVWSKIDPYLSFLTHQIDCFIDEKLDYSDEEINSFCCIFELSLGHAKNSVNDLLSLNSAFLLSSNVSAIKAFDLLLPISDSYWYSSFLIGSLFYFELIPGHNRKKCAIYYFERALFNLGSINTEVEILAKNWCILRLVELSLELRNFNICEQYFPMLYSLSIFDCPFWNVLYSKIWSKFLEFVQSGFVFPCFSIISKVFESETIIRKEVGKLYLELAFLTDNENLITNYQSKFYQSNSDLYNLISQLSQSFNLLHPSSINLKELENNDKVLENLIKAYEKISFGCLLLEKIKVFKAISLFVKGSIKEALQILSDEFNSNYFYPMRSLWYFRCFICTGNFKSQDFINHFFSLTSQLSAINFKIPIESAVFSVDKGDICPIKLAKIYHCYDSLDKLFGFSHHLYQIALVNHPFEANYFLGKQFLSGYFVSVNEDLAISHFTRAFNSFNSFKSCVNYSAKTWELYNDLLKILYSKHKERKEDELAFNYLVPLSSVSPSYLPDLVHVYFSKEYFLKFTEQSKIIKNSLEVDEKSSLKTTLLLCC